VPYSLGSREVGACAKPSMYRTSKGFLAYSGIEYSSAPTVGNTVGASGGSETERQIERESESKSEGESEQERGEGVQCTSGLAAW